MGIIENYNFDILENEAINLVKENLEKELEENPDICRCNDCVLDMAALALNSIKPYYRVSLLGKLYANSISDTQYAKEVEKAVKSAVAKIQKNPSHD
ncbi:MAG: late competence development ComFB family protein [Spirochaetales bacterium]|nr:late competence development ComFB family protein [Spirochaetales bacterium]